MWISFPSSPPFVEESGVLLGRFVPTSEVSIESPGVDVGGNTVVIEPCVDTVDTDFADENGAVVVDVDESAGCAALDDGAAVDDRNAVDDCGVAAFINGWSCDDETDVVDVAALLSTAIERTGARSDVVEVNTVDTGSDGGDKLEVNTADFGSVCCWFWYKNLASSWLWSPEWYILAQRAPLCCFCSGCLPADPAERFVGDEEDWGKDDGGGGAGAGAADDDDDDDDDDDVASSSITISSVSVSSTS